jgi:NADH:ubiquinone oxidoreductase subunit E
MKLIVCIGSSCHLKGSRQVVEQLQALVRENALEDKVELVGTFCLGQCQNGVSVKIDEALFSLNPEDTKRFFEREVLTRV